jgi:nitrous oxide reductase accessory protein NosL
MTERKKTKGKTLYIKSKDRVTRTPIKTDKNNTCKTCGMLITSPEFISNLTGKTYYPKSFDPLD